ncbi:LOW QUALITY PROTEIN: hypothetical protein Cgig2_000627 [Carnegiea gigantea]|uniref:Uncharacterized protein n=1 Tax=Carnegiea gigantea TaxID=171969 RepID=A0A9Q1QGS4_9CARY|nr:LOW QUALITY PROTEIN: hypothetical protein Cgig2_000627 [Carnegiea gigantea]
MPEVVLLAMLLNDIVKLGVLCGWMIGIMESAFKKLQWSTFQAWGATGEESWRPADRRHSVTQKEMRARGRTTKPPSPVKAARSEARLAMTFKTSAYDFDISEIVQATCYAMLVNDAVELSVVSRDIAGDLKSTLKGMPSWRRSSIDEPVQEHWREHIRPPPPLPEDYHGLSPYFNFNVAEASAQDFCILELTQVIFYTVVLNDAVALGVTCVIMANTLASVLVLNPGWR